jgi:pyridoxine 4-dehydrogenase
MPLDPVVLAGVPVRRVGFGAMQLPGSGVFGPPADRDQAVAVLRRVADAGVNHIDTAQFYGPVVANELIHAALHPYPDDLVIVSKVGAARDDRGGWLGAQRPEELRAGVEANLRTLELDRIPVVNLRRHPETDVSLPEQLDAMFSMQAEGLIGAVGLSNVEVDEYDEARRRGEVACVQNAYNIVDRTHQALLDICNADGVPFVPFFPLGSAFAADRPVLNAPTVRAAASHLGVTPAQVAQAWLLDRGPTVLLISGTSSPAHLEENLAVEDVVLDAEARALLEG